MQLKHDFTHASPSMDGDIKNIVLDFQGGGANVAYSIGFVIPLLKDPHIRITGARGTSAGAMIACIMGDAINSAESYEAGRQRAVIALERFLDNLVQESAPAMHALDALANPLGAALDTAIAFNPIARFWFQGSATPPAHERSPNLPILEVLAQHQDSLRAIFGRAATHQTAAIASDTLRRLVVRALNIAPHPHDREDHVLTHAASGRFIKVHINTAKVTPHGLENVIHTGEGLTVKSLLGSAALKQFFHPSIINGERHIDGGYTQNGCLSVPADDSTQPHAIMIVGTNRPRDTALIPAHEAVLPAHEFKDTMGLELHQMYRRAAGLARLWSPGQPTIHLTTYNHCPSHNWTAKQNTSAWNIARLKEAGTIDGQNALTEHRPHFGVQPTVSRYRLEAVAHAGLTPAEKAARPRPAYAA